MTVKEAISFYQNPAADTTKKICLEIMGDFYQKNLPAHLEYLEKGIYDELPFMTEFKEQMNTIETILKEQYHGLVTR